MWFLFWSNLTYLIFAGYVCVRGFDRKTRQSRRLCGTLHATNDEKKEGGENHAKRARTSPEAKNNVKASSAN
uniref:Uncharacterized protein n=1 Tax=Arundo donax TaxID=35708 RepID=A0A0A8ZSU0_ARUDO